MHQSGGQIHGRRTCRRRDWKITASALSGVCEGPAWPEVDTDWVGVGWGGGHQTEGTSFKIVTFTEAKIKKEEFDLKGNDQAVSLVVWSSS